MNIFHVPCETNVTKEKNDFSNCHVSYMWRFLSKSIQQFLRERVTNIDTNIHIQITFRIFHIEESLCNIIEFWFYFKCNSKLKNSFYFQEFIKTALYVRDTVVTVTLTLVTLGVVAECSENSDRRT